MSLFHILSGLTLLGMFIRPIGFNAFDLNFSMTSAVVVVLIFPKTVFNREHWKRWHAYYLSLFLGILVSASFKILDLHESNVPVSRILSWSYFLLVFPLFDAIISLIIKTRSDFDARRFLLFNTIVFSVTAIIAFLGFADGKILYSPESFDMNLDTNLSAVTTYSLIYGISYSNLVFVPVAVMTMYVRDKTIWFKLFFFMIVAFAILISLKRIAIASLLLSFFFVYKRESFPLRIMFLVSILIVAYFYWDRFDILVSRFSDALSLFDGQEIKDSSTRIRSNRITMAWTAFTSSPLIGSGSGAYVYVHNGTLELLSNLGILGVPVIYKLIKPVIYFKTLSRTAKDWAIGYIIMFMTVFTFESAINRIEILYFMAFFYSLVINMNSYDYHNNTYIQ